jgi:hypothetical protein
MKRRCSMFRSAKRKQGKRETTKRGKTFAGVIGGSVLVISVLMSVLVVQSVPAYDRSGLDILCDGEYTVTGNISVCRFKDGTVIACNTTLGICRFAPDNPNTPVTILNSVSDLLILKFLKDINTKVNICALPDLVVLPIPDSTPPEGFCRRDNSGKLFIYVYNQGGSDAVASKTSLACTDGSNKVDIDTPAIPAGTGTLLGPFTLADECYIAPDFQNASFVIQVDAHNAVNESNETNNTAIGLCVPQLQ